MLTNLKLSLILSVFVMRSSLSFAGEEGMASMPKIQPKKSYAIQSTDAGEELQEQRGFGDKEPEVRMMNLMMVEGSGYEGMDMGEMKMDDSKNQSKDAHQGHHMNMGNQGMMVAQTDHKSMDQAVAKDKGKASGAQIELTKSPTTAKVGANIYEFTIKDSSGKAIPKLKPTVEVFMTSMDMGTETPKVKELKPGLYQVKANFSMQGPWAVKIISSQGEKTFDVQASK